MSGPLIGFAGMTHLGINMLAATAARGFDVLGFDPDAGRIAPLLNLEMPVVEPGLDDLVAQHKVRINFSADDADIGKCDIVYIAADVPTDDQAKSNLAPISALIDRVAAALNERAVLVVLCQVPPGFTRGISKMPHDRLIYQVETLIFGRAVERAMHPERFIVGCADPTVALPKLYENLLKSFECPVLTMRYESAELAKIAINFCLVASVGVANTLAELSEAIGADWAEIAPALKLDRRIGPHAYLSPGLGISGGNLERDLRTVLDISGDVGTDTGIVKAWMENSAYRKEWCWRVLQDRVLAKQAKVRIGILGLAYKENTDSTKNSPSLALLAHLTDRDVQVHDPEVSAEIVLFAKGRPTALECAEGVDVLILSTPWPEYRTLSIEALAKAMAGRVLIDPYRLLDGRKAVEAGFEYHALGMPAMMPR